MGRGVKPGLERITGLLDLLARPDEAYPIVHVAGTNGKTSTSRMAAALISAHGLSAGLFTSPHLDVVEQRYELSGFPMEEAEFAAAMSELAPLVDLYEERSGDGITYFELTAALGFSWFAERAVDVGVVEVGLGGRWDATNAANSEVAVVTSIGLEHTAYLGDTITAIAGEKVAILDEGTDLVSGVLDDEALAVMANRVAEQQARWFRHGAEFSAVDPRPVVTGWLFDIEGIHGEYREIDLRLRGRHQVTNFLTAVASVEALLDRSLDEAAVREAAATVTAPGRLEVVSDDPLVLMDGAHNPPGMAALASALDEEFSDTRWHLVFGAMRDKDRAAMLRAVGGRVSAASAVAADSERATPPDELATEMSEHLDAPVQSHESVAEGVEAAMASGEPVLITGSIYVVGEARKALGIRGQGRTANSE